MQTQSTAKKQSTPYMAYECVPVPFVAIQSAPFKAKDYKEKQYEKKIYKQKLEDFYIKDPTMCIWNGMWWMRKLTNSEYVVQSQWTTSKFRFSAHPHFVLLPSLFIWALLPVCIEFLPYKRTHTVNHPPNSPTPTHGGYMYVSMVLLLTRNSTWNGRWRVFGALAAAILRSKHSWILLLNVVSLNLFV